MATTEIPNRPHAAPSMVTLSTEQERQIATATVERLTAMGLSYVTAASVARKRLGEVLVELGFCDHEAVEAAVCEGRASGRPMGQILLERRQVRTHELGIAIARRFGLEYVSLDEVDPDVSAFALVPPAAMRRLDAVPIGFADDAVIVAVADPCNLLALDELTLLIERRVRTIVVTRDDLDELLTRADRLGSVAVQPEQPAAAGSPGDRVRAIIADALEKGACDVHFDLRDNRLTIRYSFEAKPGSSIARAICAAAREAGASAPSDAPAEQRHVIG